MVVPRSLPNCLKKNRLTSKVLNSVDGIPDGRNATETKDDGSVKQSPVSSAYSLVLNHCQKLESRHCTDAIFYDIAVYLKSI